VTMKIILASQSPARRDMLCRAGIVFTAVRPPVDETALKRKANALKPDALAQHLAEAKAVSVANQNPDAIVIGADQVLNLAGTIFDKPDSLDTARKQLRKLSARAHRLETAVCCAHGKEVIWRHGAAATLTMRDLSEAEIDNYLDHVGDDALTSVGAYKLESLGVQLFETVEGDFFTILGLPLLPLLSFLRSEGAIAL
jgi:septum formation protein